MDDYEKLLDLVKKKLPDIKQTGARFEIPTADVIYVGRQTVIKNFAAIAKTLRREPAHLAKFLSKELAAPPTLKDMELQLLGKIKTDIINKRVEDYAKEYVLCHECGKPDTNIEKQGNVIMLVCEACGAKRAIKR